MLLWLDALASSLILHVRDVEKPQQVTPCAEIRPERGLHFCYIGWSFRRRQRATLCEEGEQCILGPIRQSDKRRITSYCGGKNDAILHRDTYLIDAAITIFIGHKECTITEIYCIWSSFSQILRWYSILSVSSPALIVPPRMCAPGSAVLPCCR